MLTHIAKIFVVPIIAVLALLGCVSFPVHASGQNINAIIDESSQVTIKTVSPCGEPVVAVIHLYQVVNGQEREVAWDEAEILIARVSPGDYHAVSYIGEKQVAEQGFYVAANENKTVILSDATVFFSKFSVLPNYYRDDSTLESARIAYTVKNVGQMEYQADVILSVTNDSGFSEDLKLVILSPLEVGQAGFEYSYVPSSGWVDGNYCFALKLNINGKLCAGSTVEQLSVDRSNITTLGTSSAGLSESSSNILVNIIVGVAIVIIVGVWMVLRRKTCLYD